MDNTDELHVFLDKTVPITEKDKAAISKLVYGFVGAPRKSSILWRVVSIGFWVGLAYLLKEWTENWWAFGISVGFIALFSIVQLRNRRSMQMKFNKMIRPGEVRLVEGKVQDYGIAEETREGKAFPKRNFFVVLGDQKCIVEVEHLETLRYGAIVQLRYETTNNVCIDRSVVKYGDHDLDWKGPIEEVLDTEESLSAEEAKMIFAQQIAARRVRNGPYLVVAILAVIALVCDYLIMGWHWSLIVIALLFALGLRSLFKLAGKPIRQPKNAMVLNKKRVLEGVLAFQEIMNHGSRAGFQQRFWTIGTERVPVQYADSLRAEPGDRVRIHFVKPVHEASVTKLMPIAFKVERIAQRPVG